MYPDDLFFIIAKICDKFYDIFDSTEIRDEFPHSLWSDFSFWMEEFIDKIDEDEGSGHGRGKFNKVINYLLS